MYVSLLVMIAALVWLPGCDTEEAEFAGQSSQSSTRTAASQQTSGDAEPGKTADATNSETDGTSDLANADSGAQSADDGASDGASGDGDAGDGGDTGDGGDADGDDDTGNDDTGNDDGIDEGPTPTQFTEPPRFVATDNTYQIDMVWIIDNSGSMKQEAAHVRSNFSGFIDSLSGRTDLKLALVSVEHDASSPNSTGVTLPTAAAAIGGIQLSHRVESKNGLAIAAKLSCPSESSNSTRRVCGRTLSRWTRDYPAHVPAGGLTAFFRSGAKRIYVVVTDDNADHVDETNFDEMIKPYNGDRAPFVFAFRGSAESDQNPPHSECNVDGVGVAYERLAVKTGGAVFDICARDWRAHFDQLSAKVEQVARTVDVQLTAHGSDWEVTSISSVSIGGTPVEDRSLYSLQPGGIVRLDYRAFPAEGGQVEVIFLAVPKSGEGN